ADHAPGSGAASAGIPHLRSAAGALAHMAQLCRELCFHCDRLGQSPPSVALCDGSYSAPDVVQFRASVSVSLLPLATAWMAASKLAPQPVAFYAAVFFLVNATYIALIWELIEPASVKEVSPRVRRIMHIHCLERPRSSR